MNLQIRNIKKLVKSTFEKHSVSRITANSIKNIIKSEGYFVEDFSTLEPVNRTECKLEDLGIAHYTEYYDSFTYSDRSTRMVFIRGDVSDEEYMYLLSLELGRILTHSDNTGNVIGLSAKDTETAHEFAYHVKDLSNHGILYNTLKYYTGRSVVGISAVFVSIVMIVSSLIPGQLADIFTETSLTAESNNISAFDHSYTDAPDTQQKDAGSAVMSDESHKSSDSPIIDNFVIPESSRTYYATANGEKYHLEDCSYIKGRETITLTQSHISSGNYSPCSRCFK